MNEIWKDIEGFEGLYQVSNLGRVRSLDRWVHNPVNGGYYLKGRVLSQKQLRGTYKTIILSKDGKPYSFMVHRLVAFAFISQEEGKTEVNHKDEDGFNNCVENLEWCTPSYNVNYGTRNKRNSENAEKVPVLQFDLKGNFIAEYPSQIEASRQTGVRQGSISCACRGVYKTAGGFKWKLKGDM